MIIAYCLFGLALYMHLKWMCRMYADWVIGMYVVLLPAFVLIFAVKGG